jgi:hypothetical protein
MIEGAAAAFFGLRRRRAGAGRTAYLRQAFVIRPSNHNIDTAFFF